MNNYKKWFKSCFIGILFCITDIKIVFALNSTFKFKNFFKYYALTVIFIGFNCFLKFEITNIKYYNTNRSLLAYLIDKQIFFF